MLHVTAAYQHFHDHRRFDPACRKKYLMRLPDDRHVPVDRYDAELEAYRARQRERKEAGGEDA